MDPVPRSFGPLPMHLFTDIDEQYRISENDLSIAVYSTNTAGNFATHLLRIIFAELFTSDNLRVYYSYFGGGKLKKRPLDDQRKSAIRRYVQCSLGLSPPVLSPTSPIAKILVCPDFPH
jgi:hypothetical protein